MTALNKTPGARFFDADDMRAALQMVLERAGEPVAPNKRALTAKTRGLSPADAMAAVCSPRAPGETLSLDVNEPAGEPSIVATVSLAAVTQSPRDNAPAQSPSPSTPLTTQPTSPRHGDVIDANSTTIAVGAATQADATSKAISPVTAAIIGGVIALALATAALSLVKSGDDSAPETSSSEAAPTQPQEPAENRQPTHKKAPLTAPDRPTPTPSPSPKPAAAQTPDQRQRPPVTVSTKKAGPTDKTAARKPQPKRASAAKRKRKRRAKPSPTEFDGDKPL